MSRLERLPIFAEETVGLEEFRAIYDVVNCVCFRSNQTERVEKGGSRVQCGETGGSIGRKRKYPDSRSKTQTKILEMIRETYESASPRDKNSWNAENEGKNNCASSKSPSEFLSPTSNPRPSSRNSSTSNWNNENGNENEKEGFENNENNDGYCSFVLQDDSNNSVARFTERVESLVTKHYGGTIDSSKWNMLPHSLLLTNTNTATKKHEKIIPPLLTLAPHYWIFVGSSSEWLSGRREHTDSIDHDGTFHHQLLGGKLWKLRPTLELREICDQEHDMALLDKYEVLVEEGDVFVINTKLWWHQTEIPPGCSVSYARDLYLGEAPSFEPKDQICQESVGNRETSWASGFLPRGTTLVVDHVIEDEDGDCTNTDEDEDDIISSLYHHLVPPAIIRTRLASRANCKLVLLSTEQGSGSTNNFDSEKVDKEKLKNGGRSKTVGRKTPRRKQVALEMIRDIQEGEEFMLLLEEKVVGS